MLKSSAEYKCIYGQIVKSQNSLQWNVWLTHFWITPNVMFGSKLRKCLNWEKHVPVLWNCYWWPFCNKYQTLYTSVPCDQETTIDIRGVDRKVINMHSIGECSISQKICMQDVVN